MNVEAFINLQRNVLTSFLCISDCKIKNIFLICNSIND